LVTFTGSAAFTIDFSSSTLNPLLLGFVSGTYTSDSSYIITSPNAVDMSPIDTFFIRITNLPMNNICSESLSFTFFVNVNQTTGQYLYLSTGEDKQCVDLGASFNVNYFDVELRNRDGSFCSLLGIPWAFVVSLEE
jgi:hypothetical protein